MATCPSCGVSSRAEPDVIVVEPVLVAKPPGTFSIAGAQLKTSAYEQLQMRCTRCGFAVLGHLDDESFVATQDAVRASLDKLDRSTGKAVETH